uniref:Protein C10 n=1 Tax=Alexandrium catenella TaxID=2925 RepID=A0A7S1SGK6_ALECA
MAPVKLTREDAIAMQDMLIEEYSKDDFQRRLHAAWKVSNRGPEVVRAQNKDKSKKTLCLPVQIPIVQQFGFDGSERGVQQSLSAFMGELNRDPEIAERNSRMAILVNPDLQEPRGDLEEAEVEAAEEALVQFVKVELGGVEEEVQVHSKFGPVLLLMDGREQYLNWSDGHPTKAGTNFVNYTWLTKNWRQRSSTDKSVLINIAAKKNRGVRERLGQA